MAHLVEKEALLRANSAMMLTLVGGGLIVCAFGAVIFDIGRAVGVWSTRPKHGVGGQRADKSAPRTKVLHRVRGPNGALRQ